MYVLNDEGKCEEALVPVRLIDYMKKNEKEEIFNVSGKKNVSWAVGEKNI